MLYKPISSACNDLQLGTTMYSVVSYNLNKPMGDTKMTITSHINVENTAMNRSICIDTRLCSMYEEFFLGWSGAVTRITPEQTYALVDQLKGRKTNDRVLGELYGRVKSYQGLIFLNAELPISGELFKAILHTYE